MPKTVKEVLNKKEVFLKVSKAAFDDVDTDGSGEIDSNELGRVMIKIAKEMGTIPPSKEDIKEMFDNIDTDHSGEIDFNEFQNLIKSILTCMWLDEQDSDDDQNNENCINKNKK